MNRRQLMPLFVLALMVAMVELILSCSGNTNYCGSYDQFGVFVPGQCATPVPPVGYHLAQINVCQGPPMIPTPTPKASVTPTGKPTATLTPTPCPTSTTVTVPNTMQFNASGVFQKGKYTRYQDITNSASWFTNNANIMYNGGGQFTSVNPGCSCIYASSGGIVSGPMGVSIAPASGPQPECTPCATATPTSTAAPITRVPEGAATPGVARMAIGVEQWQFDAGTAVAGPVAVARDGRSALVTAGRRLIVLDSHGAVVFARPGGGFTAQISPAGIVYAEGPSGGLFAYNPDGSMRWSASLAAGPGPLALGRDGTIYYADSGQLSAVDDSGAVRWNAAVPGVTQVAVMDDSVIVANDGGITAFSSDGAVAWTFAPESGIAGGVASDSSAVYLLSNDGTVHALSLSDGTELWHANVGSAAGGIAVSESGTVYVSAERLFAFSATGAQLWSGAPIALGKIPPVAGAGGVFVAVNQDKVAFFNKNAELNWIAGKFKQIASLSLTPTGLLFIGQTNGKLSILKVATE